jgi:hypothetical protein
VEQPSAQSHLAHLRTVASAQVAIQGRRGVGSVLRLTHTYLCVFVGDRVNRDE